MTNLFFPTSRQQKAEASDPHSACIAMAGWTPEDWTPPDEISRFPLLEICPEAPAYFAQAGHFTARDLRSIVALLNLEIDHRDQEEIYRLVLERCERAPWVLPMLEARVAAKRMSAGSKSRRKVPMIFSKMPLMKLCLRCNPHLHSRTGELLSPEVEADIAVAAFCEYAIALYHKKRREDDIDHMDDEASRILLFEGPAEIIAEELGEIQDVDDWEDHAALILALAAGYPDSVSDQLHLHAITTLRALSDGIATSTAAEDLYKLAALAFVCAKQADGLKTPLRDVVLHEISKLGLAHKPDQVDAQTIETFSTALDEGLAGSLRARKIRITELEENAAETKEKIQAAGESEDYALLAEFAAKAKEEKEALGAARKEQSEFLAYLERLLSDGVDDPTVDLKGIRGFLAQVSMDATEEASAHDALATDPFAEASRAIADDEIDDDIEDDDEADDEDDHPCDDADTSSVGDASDDQAEIRPVAEDDGKDVAEEGVTPDGDESGSDPLEDPDELQGSDDDVHVEADEVPGTDHGEAPGTDIDIEPASSPADVEPPVDSSPPVSPDILAALIERDLLGVAADAAESFELHGRPWPIEAAVLKAAAGSRAPQRDYGPDTQRFQSLASRAAGVVSSDFGSVLLVGALMRPSIFEKSASGLWSGLPRLCRGNLGQHLQQAVEAISELDYDFPPDADELARLAGAKRVPQRQRIATQLGQWADTVSNKTSRWPFATAVMHHVASEDGPIGAARAAIDADRSDAPRLAQDAIEALSSASEIENVSVEFAANSPRQNARLHPKGVEYLERQFDEPLGLLAGWLRATAREASQGQQSEARMRATIGNLVSRLEKAQAGLSTEADRAPDALTAALSRWIAAQIDETLRALRGEDVGSFATLEEALTAERDLLPSSVRGSLDVPDLRFDAFRDMLLSDAVPDPEGALLQARKEGSFETATRLATRFGIDAQDAIAQDMATFAKTWEAEIAARSRGLKTLAKVDYKHQDEIARWLSWCDIALARLAAIKNRSEVHDLAEIPAATADLDAISSMIEDKIREDQVERIAQYRNERNAEEADALLAGLEGVTVEATEDRIAQLRDGRSAATFETELGGIISDFAPEFLAFAASPGWPATDAAFEQAVAAEGPLHIEEDRRAAGLDFIHLYRAIGASLAQKQPSVPKIRALFEDIGYDNVKIHDFRPLGRTGVWQGRLTGSIRTALTDEWFLPPVFGSQASAGTNFLLVGPDVLSENIMKAVSPDTPSIFLCAGTLDAAKRHELAERLRAKVIPAVLVDEALIGFAATRRQTRAHTIFECGLPYGRVEPYTTDAGKLPPEMFFGRGEEIRLIMSKTADGCLVYGGRQLGKSALLGHIERTQHAPEQDRIVVNREVRWLGNSEKTSEIWTHLASMLSPEVVKPSSRTADEVSRDIEAWLMHKPHGRVIAMFDEADNFMDADTREDYPELARIKKLMEQTGRAFKVVFAGLHNVQRMYRQPNSPLAHLGQPICIGPLNRTEDDKRAAYDLVVTPMRAAGFRFESHEAVEEILAWANYYPSLVQEYMKGLLSTLHGSGTGKSYKRDVDGPLWPIPSDTLFAHRGFGHIESRIRYKFHLTLGLDPRYALVAYTLGRLNAEGQEDKARVTGFDTEDLLEEASVFWPNSSESPSLAAFEALLEELFDLGVLGRVPISGTKRYRYLLGSRQVATMLGSGDDIYHALGEIEEKDPAVAYDRAIHRRRYSTGNVSDQSDWHYCPLTDLQIERIVLPESVPVQIVCGLKVLGLSTVGPALKRIALAGRLPGARDRSIAVDLVKNTRELRASVDRKSGDGHDAILVFSPDTQKQAHEAISWLERQPRVIGGKVRPVLLLDAAESNMRDIATRRPEQSQFLAAWGAEMVRVHLHHIEKVELDTRTLRDAILRATGGVPSETIKLISAMRVASDPMEAARDWKSTLKVPPALLKGALGQVLSILDMADGEDYDAFNELVREHVGSDLVDLGPDLVATGLVSAWKPNSGRIRRSALGDILSRNTAI
ncbi:hypothetical protein GTA62_18800 [Roseobacter sp. HKCCD9010]|nr:MULTISPECIES: hypothetical protein [unclassified Roseobacter]MBF9052037.1 hypothetical protein [Rhodobacterales bacterium HKCCD4356]NOD28065.1 hypothetical protein [Roseobacter sp. HKCCD8430-2]NNV13961.1 hypothetical protein [Roseobacter sp. HKCCD7357]NNV18202.1 hypothetical protein [Roseobacter sp. HKCCD8768]NNV27662.1 hypothetical protein [Roseobacter sp. HKCCD8192]